MNIKKKRKIMIKNIQTKDKKKKKYILAVIAITNLTGCSPNKPLSRLQKGARLANQVNALGRPSEKNKKIK
jgi:hypothetical protein